MNNQDLVRSIRSEIATLRNKGHDAISLAALDSYLERLASLTVGDPPQIDQLALQQARAQLDIALAQYKRAADEDLEMFRSVIAAGQTARQASMLINGGAATALLAFVAHVVTSGASKTIVARLALPLGWFLGGILASAVASGATYLAQGSWSRRRNIRGQVFNLVAILLVIVSYVTFASACWSGFSILREFVP